MAKKACVFLLNFRCIHQKKRRKETMGTSVFHLFMNKIGWMFVLSKNNTKISLVRFQKKDIKKPFIKIKM